MDIIPTEITTHILLYCGRPYDIWELRKVCKHFHEIVHSLKDVNFLKVKDQVSAYKIGTDSSVNCWPDVLIDAILKGYIEKYMAVYNLLNISINISLKGYINPLLTRQEFNKNVSTRLRTVLRILDLDSKEIILFDERLIAPDTISQYRSRICYRIIINLLRITSPKYMFHAEDSDFAVSSKDDTEFGIIKDALKIMNIIMKIGAIEDSKKIANIYLSAKKFGHDQLNTIFISEKLEKKKVEGLRSNSKKLVEYISQEEESIEFNDIVLNGDTERIGKYLDDNKEAQTHNSYLYNDNNIFYKIISLKVFNMINYSNSYNAPPIRKYNAAEFEKLFNLLVEKQPDQAKFYFTNFYLRNNNKIFTIDTIFSTGNLSIVKKIVDIALNQTNESSIFRSNIIAAAYLLFFMLKYSHRFHCQDSLKIVKYLTNFIENWPVGQSHENYEQLFEILVSAACINLNSYIDLLLPYIMYYLELPGDRKLLFNELFIGAFSPFGDGKLKVGALNLMKKIFDKNRDSISMSKYSAAIRRYFSSSYVKAAEIDKNFLIPMLEIVNYWEDNDSVRFVSERIILFTAAAIIGKWGVWRFAREILDKYKFLSSSTTFDSEDNSYVVKHLVDAAEGARLFDLGELIKKWYSNSLEEVHIQKKQKL